MEHAVEDPDGAHSSPRPAGLPSASPAPQKRPRDYGEELKGLSPSGDEVSPRERSASALKRRRVHYDSAADGHSGSDSEGLDDGEIIELPQPSLVTPLASAENAPQVPQVGLHPEATNTSNAPASVSPKNTETTAPSEEQEVPGQTQADCSINQGGEDASSPDKSHPQASLPGWNHGVQLGMRTTFGAKPANIFFKAPHEDSKGADRTLKQQAEKEKKPGRSQDRLSSFEASNEAWNFPLDLPEIPAPMVASENTDFWVALLKRWIAHLAQANSDRAFRLNYKVVRAGWPLYFTRKMGFLQGKRREITATGAIAQNFMASLAKNDIESLIVHALRGPSTSQLEQDTSLTASSRLDQDRESRLQAKYFPGAEDPSQHCLSCSGIGHATHACPELSCQFCESKSHTSFGCPTRLRCDKCRQIGHSVVTCQEKLALAADELGGCTFCKGDHQDQDCFEIWRSFKPSVINVKKVKSIPAFCYVCGGKDHYGPECSLSDKSGRAANRTTWSQANRDIYIDPESENVAIAWVGVDISQAMKGQFHILGRAKRKGHTYFISSDESEEDLIHAPIKKAQPRTEIKIASKIGTIAEKSRGRGSSYGSWQPPLPPGPPPPLAEDESRNQFQPASSGTLPPRPKAPARGRPLGRGRAGYRGRGRGRGK
ncbi:hypothetical protein F5Y14DRAFT_100355 [Nemania sp. NC0429]|nr:hypothetical protein F5Y14DRAFT_100355 [Nemania sp. NC0429]